MRTALIFACAAAACTLATADEKTKGTPVKLDKLTSIAPAEWKVEKPANRLRSHQFRLAGGKDAADAELAIFPDVGTFEKELPRWKPRFDVPEGKTIDDISKTERFKAGAAEVAIFDVTGTWRYKERPFDPKSKEEVRPNSRVVFVIVATPDSNHHVRLSGPASTVNAHHKAFMQWLKAFK